jgi:hypothetical protein
MLRKTLRKPLLTLCGLATLAIPALAHYNPYPFGTADWDLREEQWKAAERRDRINDKLADHKIKEDAEMREWESHMVAPRLYSDPFPHTEPRDPQHNSGGITLFGIHF